MVCKKKKTIERIVHRLGVEGHGRREGTPRNGVGLPCTQEFGTRPRGYKRLQPVIPGGPRSKREIVAHEQKSQNVVDGRFGPYMGTDRNGHGWHRLPSCDCDCVVNRAKDSPTAWLRGMLYTLVDKRELLGRDYIDFSSLFQT